MSNPCATSVAGNLDDLPVVDFISRFNLDDYTHDVQGVKRVRGSNRIQTAYRLSRRADLTAPTANILPNGLPDQFSFACSFRKRPSQEDSWTLIDVQDENGQSQFSLSFHPKKQTLEFLPDSRGQVLVFSNVDCDDGQWNKVHLGLSVESVTLFLNCHKHSTLPLPIELRSDLNIRGTTTLAKYGSGLGTVPVSLFLTIFSIFFPFSIFPFSILNFHLPFTIHHLPFTIWQL